MERVAYNLKKLANWGVTIGASIAFTIAVVIYVASTQNLVKPANTPEAIDFFVNYSGEYAFALITGFVAKAIPWLLVFCLIGSVIKYFSDAYYEEDKKESLRLIIVNACLSLVAMIIQNELIKFWEVLVLLIVGIMLFGYVFLSNKQ